jgi:hypothetical protein
MMHTPKGFKLLESLERSPDKSFLIEGETAYPGAELGLDMDRLAYFAISVFWRAGVHRWPSKMTLNRTYSIELGDRCLAPMREFLMGAEFPDGIALRITAAKDVFSQGYAYFPAITVGIPVRSFGFLCCGILFELFIRDPMMPPFDRILFGRGWPETNNSARPERQDAPRRWSIASNGPSGEEYASLTHGSQGPGA